jgi:hypothetical protein
VGGRWMWMVGGRADVEVDVGSAPNDGIAVRYIRIVRIT